MSELGLGTAQFGKDYGIANKRGKIPENEIEAILDYAIQKDIRYIDTARAYGVSEKIIGKYLKKQGKSFRLISKLTPNYSQDFDESFSETLCNLGVQELYGYLYHHFKTYLENKSSWSLFEHYKRKGKIHKIGFSLYYPWELEKIMENKLEFDIVQIPYNIFDQRFAPYFEELKAMNVEIHVRSVYLQGLVFLLPDQLDSVFNELKEKLIHLHKISEYNHISISSICLNFGLLNPHVDVLIVGIDNIENLKSNVKALEDSDIVKKIYNELLDMMISNEKIIIPSEWKK